MESKRKEVDGESEQINNKSVNTEERNKLASRSSETGVRDLTRTQRCLVVTELGNTPRHKHQFLALFHPSWQLLSSYPVTNNGEVDKCTVDLMTFCEPGTCGLMPKECIEVPSGQRPKAHRSAQCYFQRLSKSYAKSKYEFGLSINFMATSSFAEVVKSYDFVMRSDVDAMLAPSLRTWVPEFGSALGEGFSGTNFTHSRLESIANKLGLKHHGIHGMQSTFYVRASKVVAFAKLLVNLTEHLYNEEFTPNACREVEHLGGQCSWPVWYRPVSSLYATDLAANHLLGEPAFRKNQVTSKLDHCSTDCWSDSDATGSPSNWTWTSGNPGNLSATSFAASDIGQFHLLSTKHLFGGFLVSNDDNLEDFCKLAQDTWPQFAMQGPSAWGTSNESAATYFMRVLSHSIPSMCNHTVLPQAFI